MNKWCFVLIMSVCFACGSKTSVEVPDITKPGQVSVNRNSDQQYNDQLDLEDAQFDSYDFDVGGDQQYNDQLDLEDAQFDSYDFDVGAESECIGEACIEEVVCQPQCSGKECGDDGCGGSCGQCPEGSSCVDGKCIPECQNECDVEGEKKCDGNKIVECKKEDGCYKWVVVDECSGQYACQQGECVCMPDCEGKECGPDGCGSVCGTCPAGYDCVNGKCVSGCQDECNQVGKKECVGNAVVECGQWDEDPCLDFKQVEVCGDGEQCVNGSCVCVPQCAGKECGDDGCGGSCGTCPANYECIDGKCVQQVCGPVCGDGCCGDNEDECSCPQDCSPVCGNGCCGGGEDTCSCPQDCGSVCGDGCCNGDEDTCSCPADCGVECGDGCCSEGEVCPADCGSTEPLECSGGEVEVNGFCAPVVVLLVSADAEPEFYCPEGYELVGRWKTSPGLLNEGMEGLDVNKFKIDAGWAYLCSARPNEVKAVVTHNDCSGAESSCPGQIRGTWHVGAGCSGTTYGVDSNGVALQAGWMGLCVVGDWQVKVEPSHDDCAPNQPPGCGSWQTKGSWHVRAAEGCSGGMVGTGSSGSQIKSGWMQLCEQSTHYPPADPSTLDNKVLAGYQGWFAAQGDGAGIGWVHWSNGGVPSASNVTFDAWPDLSEFPEDELYPTQLHYPDGSVAKLYSAYNYNTVKRHVKWMAEYGIDGAFLQRFVNELSDPGKLAFRNKVLDNISKACAEFGRAFAVMYDISGANPDTFIQTIKDDWKWIVDSGYTDSPGYLHHNGKPVVGIWGFGFPDRPGTAQEALDLIDWFHNQAPSKYQAYIVGGVPYTWRNCGNDCKGAEFKQVFEAYDTISPWSVGRYKGNGEFLMKFMTIVQPDKAEADDLGKGYAPVAWPGFSWSHLKNDPSLFNAYPRNGGEFFWFQILKYKSINPQFIYLAMFDEVDEGTALYKIAPDKQHTPVETNFIHLAVDGWDLPSDWFLRLSGAASKLMHGQFKQSVGMWPIGDVDFPYPPN